jgi:hypothetical protein
MVVVGICACSTGGVGFADAGEDAATADQQSEDASSADAARVIADATADARDAGGAEADANPDLACATAPTQDACLTCCENDHPTASQVVNQALFTCACVPSVCATECAASFCVNRGADATCTMCLQPTLTGVCEKPLLAACLADPECTAWRNCQIPCPSRPP